jgi:signal transduction histidine kinase
MTESLGESVAFGPEELLRRYEHYLRYQIETLDLIAQHAPIDRTLEKICELVEHTLPGTAALVLVTDDVYPMRMFSSAPFAEQLLEAIVAPVTAALDRLDVVPDDPQHLIVVDPTSPGYTVWCIPVVGLGSVPLGALCVRRDWDDHPTERATILMDHSSRLVQVAIEQHLAERRIIGMLTAERKQIAADLHDDPVQAVTAVSLVLQRLAMEVPSEQAELLGQARTTVNGAIERMRRMLFELHPTALDEEGLAVAVEVYLEETFEPSGVEWKVVDTMEREPDAHLASLAYRLIHEALSNVVAHAAATSVLVELGSRDGGLVVRVVDDGVGFDPEVIPHHRPGHLGIHTAHDLARRASGTMQIESAPGNGCSVEIWLPYVLHH